MIRSLPAILGFALLFSPSPAVAQTSGEGIPAAVRPGLTVSIVDDEGRQVDGRVMNVSAEAIRLSLHGTSEEIRFDRIVRIDKPDSLKNGALIGLGVGLSLGISGATMQAGGPGGNEAKWVLASILSNSVACTLLGTGLDALVDSRRTLYERGRRTQAGVTPIVGRGVRGAGVSVSW
jgi:hypothetical protein